MISAGEFTTFSSTLPEWVPEWFARKMCARDGFETLELLADAALLDLSVSYVPRFLSPAPSPAIPQFSMLFSDTLSSYRLVSPSASSNASISPNTSPRTSPVISPASTPNTSSINTPCNGPPVLPSRSLEDEFACQLATLARDGKRVKFADPKDAPCDAPATRLRPRRATGASTTAATQARKHRRSEEDEEKWAAAGLVPAKKARLAKASEVIPCAAL
ncbi:uncharacterized protein PHACADRAFT_187803 [Phanerochaete carnosa HHB-10118-sp]|uniref:Uncharacterized protein n=1 Tax=Phanerochaete carnosa (strain HHB-10118-sp) TaxID=650164 RepID=K5VXB1_PHACS|nr:uncharacterized protein PHACADRAFT_187803 [Phanerochaete carnosa HHB-10118-sp]EKM51244.1 hypothetical protein PHACADRAFT_187803 [Phanerochaete carnosa HHB-10118-sp]